MWVAQFFGFDKPNRWITSGGLGTMGFGLPAALGAQLANPGRLVIDIAGDASVQTTMKELSTAIQHQAPIKIFILSDEHPGMIGITAFLLCGLIVLAVAARLPEMPNEGETTSVGGFFVLAPLLLFAVFTAAAFEQILLSLFAVYGAALGIAEGRIASLITCFIAGNAALQILLGRVAERFGSTRMMLFCVLVCLAGCLLLPSVFTTWLIWPLVFVWGGVSFGIYTLSLIQLGERFAGQALIAGNAAFALVWGIGGIVGSPATGLAMQLIGHQGLPLSLGLLSCVLAVFLMTRKWRG